MLTDRTFWTNLVLYAIVLVVAVVSHDLSRELCIETECLLKKFFLNLLGLLKAQGLLGETLVKTIRLGLVLDVPCKHFY